MFGDAEFDDVGILTDVLSEHNISLHAGDTWSFRDLSLVGQGVVALSNTLGGWSTLVELLGQTVEFRRLSVNPKLRNNPEDSFFPFIARDDATLCTSPVACGGNQRVTFFDRLFTSSESYIRGTVVHELGHIIGDNYPGLEQAFSALSTNSISEYGNEGRPSEYFAEGLADWVYGRRYNPRADNRTNLEPLQVDYLESVLKSGY